MSARQHATKLETRLRGQRIFRMRLRGLTIEEIANQEKLSDRMVYWYLQQYQRVIDRRTRNLTVSLIAGILVANLEERTRQLWALLLGAGVPGEKLTSLRQLMDEDEQVVKLMQSLGLVHKEADRVELTVFMQELMDAVKEVIPDVRTLNRLAKRLNQRAASLGGWDAARGEAPGSPAGRQPVH